MKNILFVLLLHLSAVPCMAQSVIKRVEPANWWIGMVYSNIQVLIYGDNLQQYDVSLQYPGVKLARVHRPENRNYLFLDIDIDAVAKPGSFDILLTGAKGVAARYAYQLLKRSAKAGRNQGVNSGDLIYLLMPDRFANGDTANDHMPSMLDQSFSRDSMYYRHGGDIQGVMDHLDYLNKLGITTIWMTPEIENDMKQSSYHGYAATDLYRIDPRYGSNALYRDYVAHAHQKGLKVIKDVAPNHVGTEHWFIKDMPMKDWVHQWPVYTNTSYRDQAVMDPHGSPEDRRKMLDGWFVPSMPDMNEENPYVAKYLTQNYLWWLEYAGIDGLRIDTYPYNDPGFMAQWVAAVRAEYPEISIFGETLVNSVPAQAFFTEGNTMNRGLNTHLLGVTDAQVKDAIYEAINGKSGWMDGVNRLYAVLAQDFLYQDPTHNVVFLDNHDMSRMYSMLQEDFSKYKAALALLLTTRGVPQVYYGTEILMKNFSDPDGKVRADFKGGWPSDKVNKFVKEGRTEQENAAWNYFALLANYRKQSEALRFGKLMQYAPEDDVYVYFRYTEKETVMIAYNASGKQQQVSSSRFASRTKGFSHVKNITKEGESALLGELTIPANTVYIFELTQ